MSKRLMLTLTLLLAACAMPLSSVLVDQPAAQATVDPASQAEVARPAIATAPPATLVPTVPAPATLETALIVSMWDESSGTTALAPVDPFTGGTLEGYDPLVLGQGFSSARSPDGQLLATINYGGEGCQAWAGGTMCRPEQGVLHLIELAAWRETATTVQVETHASFLVFSADGQRLAIGQTAWPTPRVLLVDVAAGALLAETTLEFFPTEAAFSADGARLLVYGRHYTESNGFNPSPRAAALDAASLAVEWQAALPAVLDGQYVDPKAANVHDESEWWMPAAVFAPGAQRLYVVHADHDRLTTVDFAAQTVTAVDVGPAQSWLDRLMALTAGVAEAKILNGTEKNAVLSADEQRLYVVGAHIDTRSGQYTRTPLGLQVIDTAAGVELERYDTRAGQVSLAPAGQHLFLTDWDTHTRVEVVALDGLTPTAELPERELYPARLVNGQPVLLGLKVTAQSISVRWLDPAAFTTLAEWEAPSVWWLVP